MTKKDLTALREFIVARIADRRKLGAYNADAEGILNLWEIELKIVDHLLRKPAKKK